MEMLPNQPQPTEDILFDISHNLVRANRGKRFANWLIDSIACNLFSRFFFRLLYASSIGDYFVLRIENEYMVALVRVIIGYGFFALFMGILEAASKGKSLGKLITQTRAVNEDGSPITPKTAFIRSLCRLVPFEIFSALGSPPHPWHDRWSKTYVIDERNSKIH